MKTALRTASFLAVTLLVWACDKDNNREITSNKLQGTWSLTNFVMTDCEDEEENIEFEVTCTAQNCSRIILSANGTIKTELTLGGKTEMDHGTYVLAGNSLQICDPSGNECYPASFEISSDGEILTIEDLDEEAYCKTIAVYEKI